MKVLTTNFVQCAVPSCQRSTNAFPLKYNDCAMVRRELDFDPEFIVNMLGKLDWSALLSVASDLGNTSLPEAKPEIEDPEAPETMQVIKDLHTLLLEAQIQEGEMTCRNCGHVYYIKNSIPNFLLPPHLA